MQLGADVQAQVGDRVVSIRYPVWMNVPAPLLNREDVVTARLGNMTFGTAGALVPLEETELEVVRLAGTTPSGAGLVDTNLVGPMANLEEMVREFRPDGSAYLLAARVNGKAASAFPDGPPEEAGNEDAAGGETAAGEGTESDGTGNEEPAADEAAPAHLVEGEVNLIVVGDTDLLQDRFWVRQQNLFGRPLPVPISANGSFVINALDNLTGSGDLIGIRSRGRFQRPFTMVDQLRQEAELRFREKERELLQRLEETDARLTELRTGEDDEAVLTAEQREAIEEFTRQQIRIRRELRDVRHSLRKDIESLEAWLKFVNIGLVPIIIVIGGLLAGLHRMRRRRNAMRPGVA